MTALYNTIGINYAQLRKPDPRIAVQINRALGDAAQVLNVGAGAGSYEPSGCTVTAVEPSIEMIRQRPANRPARQIQAHAETLPFADKSFDAAMAVLTVHHWTDTARGLAELRRVSRGPVVVLTFDPTMTVFWLGRYLPQLFTLDADQMPRMEDYGATLGPVRIEPVPVPNDCEDGFLCAYWRRPEAYLDERVRAAISSFWKIGDISLALEQLRTDLESGAWHETHADLLTRRELDCGYRLIVSEAD